MILLVVSNSLVHTERFLAMRWQLYPVSQYVAHLLKWRTGRTFLSEKSFARSSFLNFSNAFFYCLLIVYQEWVMLFNEREEPYLACSPMKNISSSHISGTPGLAVQSYTSVHWGKTAQPLSSVIPLHGWVQVGWLPDLVLKILLQPNGEILNR